MNRNNFWRLVLVVLVILWSLYELYPPKGRDLLLYFREKAVNRDPAFSAFFQKAQALQKAMPEKPYDNLAEAIGTNDITRYFPSFGAKDQVHPTSYILNRLQREAAGRIRLGLEFALVVQQLLDPIPIGLEPVDLALALLGVVPLLEQNLQHVLQALEGGGLAIGGIGELAVLE